jgi:SAM-dependent methyltransferase
VEAEEVKTTIPCLNDDKEWGCPPKYLVEATMSEAVRHAQGDSAVTPRSTLDLGCGHHPRNPFFAKIRYGADLFADPDRNISQWDASFDPLPFPDNSMDFVTAFDFLEHVPRVVYYPTRRNSFTELMNEIHRVLKPCGLFFSVTPMYPKLGAFADPTHVNVMSPETLINYFDDTLRWADKYGFVGSFYPDVASMRIEGHHTHLVMQAIKDWCKSPPRAENDPKRVLKEEQEALEAVSKAEGQPTTTGNEYDVLMQAIRTQTLTQIDEQFQGNFVLDRLDSHL